MTLYELGEEYGKSAAPIRARLKELRTQLKTAETAEERWRLKRRISELTPMLTYCNRLEEYCKRYYERGYYIGDGAFDGKRQQLRLPAEENPRAIDHPSHIDKRTFTRATGSSSRMFDKESDIFRSGGRVRKKQIDRMQKFLSRSG